jgi:long-chain fatty acid transport protein
MTTSLKTPAVAISLLALLLAPLPSLAGGFFIPSANARDLALSEAAVAAQTGPEASYLNSSALAGHEGFAASASFMGLFNATTWTDASLGSNATASIESKPVTPLAASLSYGGVLPHGVGFGLGVSLNVAGGGSLNWPANWPGAKRIEKVKLQLFAVETAVAVQPLPFLKVGLSMVYFRGTEELSQQLGFVNSVGDAQLGLAGAAATFGASAQLDAIVIPLSVAVNYRHQADVQFRGSAHFTGVPPSFQTLLQDQSVSAHLPVPNQTTVGLSYVFPMRIQLMAAYTFERWSVYKEDRFVGSLGFTVSVPRHWVDAQVYRLGVEWSDAFVHGLTLRIGGLRSISPQPTDTVSPTLTDGNSTAFSVGVGYQLLRSLRIDVGYQHAFFDAVTATGTEAFPGTYNTLVDLVSLGLSFRMD